MRESTFTLVYWGFIPSFPTKGQPEKKSGTQKSIFGVCVMKVSDFQPDSILAWEPKREKATDLEWKCTPEN